MTTIDAPESMYRSVEGLGVWEHRGKVAAVGVGHSPTSRRWDGRPETTVGAGSILSMRQAMDDAGVSPDQVDGLVIVPVTTTGAHWPEDVPLPTDVINSFNQTDDPLDGIGQLSADWLETEHARTYQRQVQDARARLHVRRHSQCGTGHWRRPRRNLPGRQGLAQPHWKLQPRRPQRGGPRPRLGRHRSGTLHSGARPDATARPCSSPSTAISTARTTT